MVNGSKETLTGLIVVRLYPCNPYLWQAEVVARLRHLVQLQRGQEDDELRVAILDLVPDAPEEAGLLLAVERGRLVRLHRHDPPEDVRPGDLGVAHLEADPLHQGDALQLGQVGQIGHLLVEDELVLLLAVLQLAVDDVGGELEAVGDDRLVVDVEALEKGNIRKSILRSFCEHFVIIL